MAKKGQKFKTWTADEKYNVIKPIIDLEISLAQTGKNTGVSNSMLHRWIKSYKENGYDGLKAKKKPRILLTFQTKNSLRSYKLRICQLETFKNFSKVWGVTRPMNYQPYLRLISSRISVPSSIVK